MKKMILASVLALVSLASVNAATTYLYVTGSTAYRNFAEKAIYKSFDSGVVFGYDATSWPGATHTIYSGTIGGAPYIIETSWNGSEAGIQAVAGNIPISFFDSAAALSQLTASTSTSVGTPGLNTALVNIVPNYTFSDTKQAASAYNVGVSTYSSLVDSGNIGVNVFKWVASSNAGNSATFSTTVSNITTQSAKNLFASGKLPVAFLTGNTADQNNSAFLIGRNPDSGTRVTAVLESGFGTASVVKQYSPIASTTGAQAAISTSNSALVALQPWPLDTVNGSVIAQFNSGYSSGGKLAAAVGNVNWGSSALAVYTGVTSSPSNNGTGTPSGTIKNYNGANANKAIALSYVSANDADSLITSGNLVELAYNGSKLGVTTYSASQDLIQGRYTFWSFEHILTSAANLSDPAIVAILANLQSSSSRIDSKVVLVSDLSVTRASDGAVVTKNYAGY